MKVQVNVSIAMLHSLQTNRKYNMKKIVFIFILTISIFQLTRCGCERKEESKSNADDIKTVCLNLIIKSYYTNRNIF